MKTHVVHYHFPTKVVSRKRFRKTKLKIPAKKYPVPATITPQRILPSPKMERKPQTPASANIPGRPSTANPSSKFAATTKKTENALIRASTKPFTPKADSISSNKQTPKTTAETTMTIALNKSTAITLPKNIQRPTLPPQFRIEVTAKVTAPKMAATSNGTRINTALISTGAPGIEVPTVPARR